jgi:hypothetical protein
MFHSVCSAIKTTDRYWSKKEQKDVEQLQCLVWLLKRILKRIALSRYFDDTGERTALMMHINEFYLII